MAPLPPLALFRAPVTKVKTGGVPVTAVFGPVLGGIIVNPALPQDQGLSTVEILYVDLTGPAALGETSTTVPIQPGGAFFLPANLLSNVSVNAASSGHLFSAVIWQPQTPPTPIPPIGPFPPAGPTTLLKVIPSYLYQEYSDDDDLQAFVNAFNGLAQQYVDAFNQIGLPIYTGSMIAGTLLDWVAQGLYGISRPVLSSGKNRDLGPLNTYAFNTLPLNTYRVIGPQDYAATSDDIFKRVITWHFYKGDGKVFDIRWLKRRIMRFLIGLNGTAPNVPNTYQISVSFGVGNQVNIRLLNGVRNVLGGAFFNGFAFNTVAFNQIFTDFENFAPLANAAILKEAIDSGALELPFQFDYVVSIV